MMPFYLKYSFFNNLLVIWRLQDSYFKFWIDRAFKKKNALLEILFVFSIRGRNTPPQDRESYNEIAEMRSGINVARWFRNQRALVRIPVESCSTIIFQIIELVMYGKKTQNKYMRIDWGHWYCEEISGKWMM